MDWTYTFTGRPETPDATHAAVKEQDGPAPVIIAERPDDEGVCDLWLLKEKDDAGARAVYGWHGCGTPALVMGMLARGLGLEPVEGQA